MKKSFTLLTLLLVCVAVIAQNRKKFDPEHHRIMQHKIMAERAGFSKEDSIKFFAIYDEMRQKEYALFGDNQKMRRGPHETDEECKAAMYHADSVQIELKKIQMVYHQKMLNVVSPKKAVRAIIAGEDFDRQTFRDMNRHFGDMKDSKKFGKKHDRDQLGKFDEPRPEDMSDGPHDGPHDGPAPDDDRPRD